MTDNHKSKFQTRSATIGIIGMGYVGLPLALRYVAVGYSVIGIDNDQAKVDALNAGQSYIGHISNNKIATARAGLFEASVDFARAVECDALILCLPTPLNKFREPDLSYVTDTMDALVPHLRQGQVVSLESTTYPGTTEEEMLPRVERSGLVVGEGIFLVYSPEREDPGNPNFETATIPKLIGGHTPACLDMGTALYEQVVDQLVPMSSTRAAEMTKLLENIHRAVNIGLVNEMKTVADKMGIDIFEVVDAAATKPFGYTAYYPGPGLGGHCIPIDPFYLTWKAKEYGLNTRFIELSGEVNRAMPEYVVSKLTEGLKGLGKSLKGSRILVLGLAYKKNVGDPRESPAAEILSLLVERGAAVEYSDPHIPAFPAMRNYHFELVSLELNAKVLQRFDAAVLVTDHDDFDYELIKEHATLIIDSRGRYREPAAHIVKA
ncbi:MAG: UDP-N-acetyl-D-glucosamine dehydrogenase [Halieaceae bacterium]|jgi:UDP-N-acetyl-D-glucosamine dehydrogenase